MSKLSKQQRSALAAIEAEVQGLPITDQFNRMQWHLEELAAMLSGMGKAALGSIREQDDDEDGQETDELEEKRRLIRSLPLPEQLGAIQWDLLQLMACVWGANEAANAARMMEHLAEIAPPGASYAPLFSDEKEAMLAESGGTPEGLREALLKRITAHKAAQRTDKAH